VSNQLITKPWDDSGFKKTLFYTFIITLGFGLMWMTFVSCLPKFAPIVAALGAIIALVLITIFAIAGNRK
jgi:tryptophan-rich sensory protein